MRGCKGNSGGSGALVALTLALAGTAAFTLLALLGGYLIALGAVALIVLAPLALAELELYERAAGLAEGTQTPEAAAHKPVSIPEAPAQLAQPTGESEIRQVA